MLCSIEHHGRLQIKKRICTCLWVPTENFPEDKISSFSSLIFCQLLLNCHLFVFYTTILPFKVHDTSVLSDKGLKKRTIWREIGNIKNIYTATEMTSRSSWRSDWDLRDPHTLLQNHRKRTDWQSDILLIGHIYSQLTRTLKEVCSAMYYNSSEVILQLLECTASSRRNIYQNRLDKHWTDMGAWKFRLASPSTSNTSTSTFSGDV